MYYVETVEIVNFEKEIMQMGNRGDLIILLKYSNGGRVGKQLYFFSLLQRAEQESPGESYQKGRFGSA